MFGFSSDGSSRMCGRQGQRHSKKPVEIVVDSRNSFVKAQSDVSDPGRQGRFPGEELFCIGPIFSCQSFFEIIFDHGFKFQKGLLKRIGLRCQAQIETECLPLFVFAL